MEWTWKMGASMEKSKRIKQNVNNDFNNSNMSQNMSQDMSNKLTFKKDQLREQSNDKLSHRAMIIQRNVNPYMINNDYNKDLEIQNRFLIPKDSNDKENDLNN